MRQSWLAVPAAVVLTAGTALADGLIPRHPYHYLHPPAALAKTNKKPKSGERMVPLVKGRNPTDLTHFTKDGQAGTGMHAGTLVLGPPAKQIDLLIKPVNLPAPLQKNYQQDGNAYLISATGRPGGKSARVTQKVGVIFRWALLPHALLVYAAKRWQVVCDITSKDWQIDSLNVACHTSVLGVFTLARRVYK